MPTFLLTLQIYKNNKIKRNNIEDVTKTCPCFSFLEKQGVLYTGYIRCKLNGRIPFLS